MASYRTVILFILLIPSLAFATELVLTASGNGDDRGYYYDVDLENCAIQADADTLKAGSTSVNKLWGFEIVFDNATVAKNSTVSSAVLRVQFKAAIVAGSTVGFSGVCGPIQADNQTAVDAVCYSQSPTWGISKDTWSANETWDITLSATEFQTLFGRAGWASGNSITLSCYDDGSSDRIMFLKSIASYAHTLTINYTAPAAAPSRGTGRFGKSTTGAYLNDR